MLIFIFIICVINLIISYKLYIILYNITSVIRTNLLKKSFDNTDIKDLYAYKDFFDIDNSFIEK